jgi:serine/threonine protein kinase
LLDKKYGRAVDWWAFGVLIYQMLLQQSPFRGEDEDEIYDAILADEPLYPIHMPRDSVSILQKLLTREPEQRLGSGPTDAQEIMSQPFFRNINWDDVYHKRITPPFQPQITSATDTSNFDSEFTSVTPVLTPVQSGKFPLESIYLVSCLTFLQYYHRLCKKNSAVSHIPPTSFEQLKARATAPTSRLHPGGTLATRSQHSLYKSRDPAYLHHKQTIRLIT